ncbi:MAG TPA: GNAT family N-acetyltransferase [Pirellulales bacterium]|nr:GNAT family N-acetyltransferase [Pirellulales bacterium]
MSALEIVKLPEYAIPADLGAQLPGLLEQCFPNTFEGRTYFKQLPHFRLLAVDGGSVVAQVGIDARVITVGGTTVSIFGLIDTAVHPARRGQGVATRLLAEVERIARAGQREFLVLMAGRHDLYLKAGYNRVHPALTRWLAIENRQSVELLTRDLSDCFMAKPLTEKSWPTGTIDMLGYVF